MSTQTNFTNSFAVLTTTFIGLLVAVLVAQPLAAQTNYFQDGVGDDTDWNEISNWTAGYLPTGAEVTAEYILGFDPVNINSGTNAHLRDVVIAYGAHLYLHSGATLRLTNSIQLCNSIECDAEMTVDGGSLYSERVGGGTAFTIGVGGGTANGPPYGYGGNGTLNVTGGGSVALAKLDLAPWGTSHAQVNLLDGEIFVNFTGKAPAENPIFSGDVANTGNSFQIALGDTGVFKAAGDHTVFFQAILDGLHPGESIVKHTSANPAFQILNTFDPHTDVPGFAGGSDETPFTGTTILRVGSASGPACDLTGDGFCDLADIDTLAGGGATSINDWLAGTATENGFGSAYLASDNDLDRDVDLTDFNTLAGNFNPVGSGAVFSTGDSNGDGSVNLSDYNTLAGSFDPIGYAGATAVPEPGTFVLAALGLLAAVVARPNSRQCG